MNKIAFFLLLCVGLLASGCAGFEELKGKDYPESAELNYKAGLDYLASENYEIAQKYFELVKSKYTFSMYATASELLIADTLLKQDLYGEAIDAYKVFQRKHPTHSCIPYSQFKIGEAYFEQINEDWWFMPPAHERDQDLTEKAMREYRRLIRVEQADGYYFDDKFSPVEIEHCKGNEYQQRRSMIYLARERVQMARRRLIDRELYVARFYMKQDKPAGAVGRLEGVFKKYPDVSDQLDIVVLLADAYREARMYKRARATWNWLSEHFPKSPEAAEQKEKLSEIDEDEREYLADKKEEEEKNRAKLEEDKKRRVAEGLQEVDPNPDPDRDAIIPLQ